jgi:hypothetical protein
MHARSYERLGDEPSSVNHATKTQQPLITLGVLANDLVINQVGPCLPKALGRLQAIVFNRHTRDARGRKCLTGHNESGPIPAIYRHSICGG